MAKTKDLLIDVARRLFAEKGMENTTMNDIAIESGKGRRTLYTYFNSKEELYLAIVEKELQYLYEKLSEIEKIDITPYFDCTKDWVPSTGRYHIIPI